MHHPCELNKFITLRYLDHKLKYRNTTEDFHSRAVCQLYCKYWCSLHPHSRFSATFESEFCGNEHIRSKISIYNSSCTVI